MTGTYACAVSAMANCADYFGILDYNNFATDYARLWALSNTYFDHEENGITCGATLTISIGSAFKAFSDEKGLTIVSNYSQDPTPYIFFKNCIDNGGIGILCTAITTSNGNEGHAMAVEGYAFIL